MMDWKRAASNQSPLGSGVPGFEDQEAAAKVLTQTDGSARRDEVKQADPILIIATKSDFA
jgi:hypothetical protein